MSIGKKFIFLNLFHDLSTVYVDYSDYKLKKSLSDNAWAGLLKN